MDNNERIYKILVKMDNGLVIDKNELELIQNCEELDLSFRDYGNIPHSICKLSKLQFLNLGGMGITCLPDEFCDLTKLSELVLRYNNLTKLPQDFGRLETLRILDISENPWEDIPKEIKQLNNLVYLNMSNCHFKSIPEWILDFKLDFHFAEFGSGIILENSTSISPDISLFQQKKASILKYFQRVKENNQIVRETKVIFLGDGLVGKTYTIDRIDNDGRKLRQDYSPDQTKGISIVHKDFIWKQKPITIHFWDFGGQQIMHSMHRCFLTNNTIYVIVLSGRAEDMERRLRYWMTSLNSFTSGKCPVIVLENRFDVRNIQSVNTTQIRRQYSNIHDVLSLNVKEAPTRVFCELRDKILDLAILQSLYGQNMPKLWADIKTKLETSTESYLTESSFKALCSDEIEEQEQCNILDWFNDLGVSFSYHQDPDHIILHGYVVLNPEWATNAIYAIINSPRSQSPNDQSLNGILTLQQIEDTLRHTKFVNERKGSIQQDSYTPTEIAYILALMENFQLSFETRETTNGARVEFIPSLCQTEEPTTIKRYMENEDLHFEIRYAYLPNNILHRFMISRYDELNAGGKWWFSGGVFKSDAYRCQALVLQEDKEGKNIISIYIKQHKNGEAWRYLTEIRKHLKESSQRLNIASDSYIIYREPGQTKIEEINLEFLLDSIKLGWDSYRSNVFKKEIPLADILKYVTSPDIANAVAKNDLLGVIVSGCYRMQKRNWLPHDENSRNDYLCDILRSAQIFVLDQTRSGIANKNAGELDFLIQNNEHKDIAIIEALNVNCINSEYIKSHITKLISDEHYNTNGLRDLYLLVYADVKNFSEFCNRYYDLICQESIYPYMLKDGIHEIEQEFNNICIWKAEFANRITLHHICVKMMPKEL